MQQIQKSKLCITIGESIHYKHTPMYEAIVYAAKKADMAGATVLRGIMSFGEESKIRSFRFFSLSQDLPITVMIVDRHEKILQFTEIIKKMLKKANRKALITIETVSEIILD